jgi:hypothetical protein
MMDVEFKYLKTNFHLCFQFSRPFILHGSLFNFVILSINHSCTHIEFKAYLHISSSTAKLTEGKAIEIQLNHKVTQFTERKCLSDNLR